MSRRKPKAPSPVEPTPIATFEPGYDGIHVRQFSLGCIAVTVRPTVSSDDNRAGAELAELLHRACSISAAPPRETEWGEGQFATVEIAPGVLAAVRITPADEVVLLAPSCALTITATGAGLLGLGLQEAGRIVGQRRAERDLRAAERAEKRRPR